MYYVYILKSVKTGRTYVGYSSDWKRRLAEHNTGQSRATKNRGPFEVLQLEEFESTADAKARELYWKSGSGRRKLKQIYRQLN